MIYKIINEKLLGNGALRAKYKVNNLGRILTNEHLIINKCPQWG